MRKELLTWAIIGVGIGGLLLGGNLWSGRKEKPSRFEPQGLIRLAWSLGLTVRLGL